VHGVVDYCRSPQNAVNKFNNAAYHFLLWLLEACRLTGFRY